MKLKRPSVATKVTFVAFAAVTLLPAYAHATTVRLGPSVPSTFTAGFVCDTVGHGCPGFTQAQHSTPEPNVIDIAPASGLVTSWRVAGRGVLKLRALRPAAGGQWVGDGTGPAATNLTGGSNAASLPIRAGDLIGVDVAGQPESEIGFADVPNAEAFGWEHPALADNGVARSPEYVEGPERLMLNADVLLAPVVSSLSPTSGAPAGGNAVKIAGLYLDGATGVAFGSTPASSFSVDSSNQITAIAPASVASTVDVRVTGPGGSSEVGSGDKYTFTAPAASTVPANPAPQPLVQGVPDLKQPILAVTSFSESATKWRRGRSLPHISSVGAPVGTTFSASLNEPGTAAATFTFAFTQSVAGRRAHGTCVAPSPGNAHKPKCKRTLAVGSFGVSGRADQNKVRFQGRLSNTKTLKPGNYAVRIRARDARGLNAVSQSLSFTIVS